jgi:ADP-heptose:LPS heptosyltransferase
LVPLLDLPDVAFYSLQIGSTGGETLTGHRSRFIDLTSKINDFADTAAFMKELDLIISVDTAAAHLAGALGLPIWTLLPLQADWRWGLEGKETRWYSTMRLFRQQTKGDWAGVIDEVGKELRAKALSRAGR